MITLKCRNCGTEKTKNILPGKHAVFGAINASNREADCCTKPDYADSAGFKQESVDKGLRELVTALRA